MQERSQTPSATPTSPSRIFTLWIPAAVAEPALILHPPPDCCAPSRLSTSIPKPHGPLCSSRPPALTTATEEAAQSTMPAR